jgi:hypothetical protein
VPDSSLLGWWALAVAVTAGALALPLAPQAAEGLRVSVCRSTGGSCGYLPQRTRCDVLSRDSSTASALVALRRSGSGSSEALVKALDGTAEVTLREPHGRDLGVLLGERLGVRVPPGRGHGLAATFRFPRHDDADAWLDHYHRREQPITAAAAGWSTPTASAGLHEGLRRVLSGLGFADLDAVRLPDAVVVDLAGEATGSAAFGRASSGLAAEPVAGAPSRLEVEVEGRTATSGDLPTAADQNEADGFVPGLAGLLGLLGPARYRVVSDASGEPARLEVSGVAEVRPDGQVAGADRLPRLREGGGSRAAIAPGADQTVVLDLRSSANRAAFDRVFRVQGPAAVPDDTAQADAVRSLVQRVADDAVYIRTTTRTTGTETTMLKGFSEDLAVPASRLSALPGCSR